MKKETNLFAVETAILPSGTFFGGEQHETGNDNEFHTCSDEEQVAVCPQDNPHDGIEIGTAPGGVKIIRYSNGFEVVRYSDGEELPMPGMPWR